MGNSYQVDTTKYLEIKRRISMHVNFNLHLNLANHLLLFSVHENLPGADQFVE